MDRGVKIESTGEAEGTDLFFVDRGDAGDEVFD